MMKAAMLKTIGDNPLTLEAYIDSQRNRFLPVLLTAEKSDEQNCSTRTSLQTQASNKRIADNIGVQRIYLRKCIEKLLK